MIVAALAMIVAAFFLVRGDLDKAFVIAAVGAVSWFLNYRVQMKEVTARADAENERQEEDLDDDKEDQD
jgi:hypothetical protein